MQQKEPSALTVSELIEELKKLPQDLQCYGYDREAIERPVVCSSGKGSFVSVQ